MALPRIETMKSIFRALIGIVALVAVHIGKDFAPHSRLVQNAKSQPQ
jgi:hypothetical protein